MFSKYKDNKKVYENILSHELNKTAFLVRRLSNSQYLYQASKSEVSNTFNRNLIIFPDKIIDTENSYNNTNGHYNITENGLYWLSTSVRVQQCNLLGYTIEIVRWRNGIPLRVRGQEFIYNSAIVTTIAASFSCLMDLLIGDFIRVEIVVQGSDAVIQPDLNHSLAEFSGFLLNA